MGDLGKGFAYKAYLMTSLDATGFSADEGFRGGRQNGFFENAQHMAPVGRLEYRGVPGLDLGTSFWTGRTGFNLRDIKGDAASSKRTLAVRVGDTSTRSLFIGCLTLPFAIALAVALAHPMLTIVLVAVPLVAIPIRNVLRGDTGRALVASLVATSRVQIAFAALFSLGVLL